MTVVAADYERIERAIDYLEAHFQDQPDLEAIAREAGLSPFHFQRLFRRWVGISPKRFVQFLTLDYAKQRLADTFDGLHHVLKVNDRAERLDLFHQGIGQPLPGHFRNAGDVVDRLFRIQFGALAADLVENVDDVRFHVEQAKLEHGEQSARPRTDDENVGFDLFGHLDNPSVGAS